MTEAALAVAAAILCCGCGMIAWSFGTPDAGGGAQTSDAGFAATRPIADADTTQAATAEAADDAEGADLGDASAVQWANCLADGGCPAPGLFCDVDSGQCFPCLDDQQCGYDLPRCNTMGTPANVCVECLVSADCSGGICEPTHQCVQSCPEHGMCPYAAAHCDARNVCSACSSDSDCSGPDMGLGRQHCNTVAGRCVMCIDDSQCPPYTPRCDPRTNECVRCLSSGDCEGGVCLPRPLQCGVIRVYEQ